MTTFGNSRAKSRKIFKYLFYNHIKKDLTCNASILQIPIGILRILKAKLASCILKIPAHIQPILKGDKAGNVP